MATKKEQVITIKPIVDRTAVIRIVGDTPLIVHKWTEKMKRALPAELKSFQMKYNAILAYCNAVTEMEQLQVKLETKSA